MRLVALLLLGSLLGGCANDLACGAGTGTPMLVAQLFFGRTVPGRSNVSNAEWDRFVDEVVVPALPAGFTALDADGAWMNPATGVTSREQTKVLIAAVPDTAGSIDAIARVRRAYASTFHQQLVGMTIRRECASF